MWDLGSEVNMVGRRDLFVHSFTWDRDGIRAMPVFDGVGGPPGIGYGKRFPEKGPKYSQD